MCVCVVYKVYKVCVCMYKRDVCKRSICKVEIVRVNLSVFFSFPKNYSLLILDRSFAKWRAVMLRREREREREGLSTYDSTRSLDLY